MEYTYLKSDESVVVLRPERRSSLRSAEFSSTEVMNLLRNRAKMRFQKDFNKSYKLPMNALQITW